MPPHLPQERYYTRNTREQDGKGPWGTTPRHSTPPNETTTSTTENSWPLSEASKTGDTSSSGAPTQSSSSRTTTTSNTGDTHNESTDASLVTSCIWRTTTST